MTHYTLAIIIGRTGKTLSPKNGDKTPLNTFLNARRLHGVQLT
jgi:hypothetical protein